MLQLILPRIGKLRNALVHLRFVNRATGEDWFICEYDRDSGLCFGRHNGAMEFFYLQELEIRRDYEKEDIVRDFAFRPTTLRKLLAT